MLIGDLLFDESGIQDAYQQLLLPYWNACNFYISYANIDNFHPEALEAPKSENQLDRWILAKLYDTTREITENMDGYQVDRYIESLASLIDGLTNWYIRRSRRRFWETEFTADKESAYKTLYYVLVNTTKLLAPVAPIISEKVYKTLTGEFSVHLADWPEIPDCYADAELLSKVETAQRLIGLTRSIRNKSRIKNRQPLSLLRVASSDPATMAVVEEFKDTIKEELNIKNIEILDNVNDIATVKYDPNFNVIREKYPKDIPSIIKAVKSGKYSLCGDVVRLDLGAGEVELDADIILVTYLAKDGLSVASDHEIIVSLDLTITEELKKEGLAREIIRSIQDARKQIGCEIMDNIKISLEGEYPAEWVETICGETLSSVSEIDAPDTVIDIDGIIKISVKK